MTTRNGAAMTSTCHFVGRTDMTRTCHIVGRADEYEFH